MQCGYLFVCHKEGWRFFTKIRTTISSCDNSASGTNNSVIVQLREGKLFLNASLPPTCRIPDFVKRMSRSYFSMYLGRVFGAKAAEAFCALKMLFSVRPDEHSLPKFGE